MDPVGILHLTGYFRMTSLTNNLCHWCTRRA